MRLEKLLTAIAAAGMLAMPTVAAAYVSPEDILFSPDFSLPPTPRAAQERVEAERAATADRRATILDQLHGAAPEADPTTLPAGATGSPDFLDIQQILQLLKDEQGGDVLYHGAAEADPSMTEDDAMMDDGTRATRDERILERIARNQEEQRAVLSQGEVIETLHGGAPLSHTGPGLVILGTSVIAGALWTLLRTGKATTVPPKA